MGNDLGDAASERGTDDEPGHHRTRCSPLRRRLLDEGTLIYVDSRT
jgi:hypothetical protein